MDGTIEDASEDGSEDGSSEDGSEDSSEDGSELSAESNSLDGVVVFTEDEILYAGLLMLGWPQGRLTRRLLKTNIKQYRTMFGIDPSSTARLWVDLQTTTIEAARVNPDESSSIEKLHWALHFLYRYPTKKERESTWHKCGNTIREACWLYVYKIKALKAEKIVFPNFTNSDIWVMTVDGTHLVTLEPGNSDFPRDPSYFSFKHHTAGFNYEVGVHLFESKCIWFSGPHKAGVYNDAKIFRECGLMHRLRQQGKKAIADEGYRGFPNEISTHNSLDTEEVREFKSRARQRHEIYNGMLKQFGVLSDRFRCKNNPSENFTAAEKLQMCFEAVNVLVQYKMQTEPLFNI